MEQLGKKENPIFKMFARKPVKSRSEYNDILFQLQKIVQSPEWKIFTDVLDERYDFLKSQLLGAKSNDDRNIIIGQMKELEAIKNVTLSKSNREYLEEFVD